MFILFNQHWLSWYNDKCSNDVKISDEKNKDCKCVLTLIQWVYLWYEWLHFIFNVWKLQIFKYLIIYKWCGNLYNTLKGISCIIWLIIISTIWRSNYHCISIQDLIDMRDHSNYEHIKSVYITIMRQNPNS